MSEQTELRDFATRVARPGTVTTWLNHWSLMHADWEPLSRTDLIGFDGTLLGIALASHGHPVVRTSADLVGPLVIREVLDKDDPIVFLGAAPGVALAAAARFPGHQILAIDGYAGLQSLESDPTPLVEARPRLVVVGLGAGAQEVWAGRIHRMLPEAAVCTAGGWLDQLASSEQYFPPWVHRARLGWALRIAREPKRLAGRYTIEALAFTRLAPSLSRRLERLGSFDGEALVVERRAPWPVTSEQPVLTAAA